MIFIQKGQGMSQNLLGQYQEVHDNKNKMEFKNMQIGEGRYRLVVKDKDGNTKDDSGWVYNLITNAGKAALAGLWNNVGSITAFTYLAVGTSTTAVAVTDTALTAEIVDTGLARASASASRVTTTVTNDTGQLTYTWTASGSKTVEEVGVFNASSGGVMYSHALTTSKVLANTDTLLATYQVKMA